MNTLQIGMKHGAELGEWGEHLGNWDNVGAQGECAGRALERQENGDNWENTRAHGNWITGRAWK